MSYFITIVISFIQSVIGFTLMSSSLMRFKEPVRIRVLLGLLAMLCGISLLSYKLLTQGFHSADSIAILAILGIELSWFLICSGDRLFVSIFSFLTFVNIYVSISYISHSLAFWYEGPTYVVVRIFIRLLIYCIILPLLYKFVRPRFRRLVDTLDREWQIAFIVPFMFLVMQILILYYPAPYWRWEMGNWSQGIIIAVYLLFLAVYNQLYLQASAIVEKYALENRQLLMSQQEKLWESELTRQKMTSDLIFQQRHDLHHHNAVIIEMLKNGNAEQLKSYMKSFESALNEHSASAICSHPIANSIFNVYARKAEVEGIKMTFQVSVPENMGIDYVDLTCIFGNALENALEGCLRVSNAAHREIVVITKYMDRRLRVQVENTCNRDIQFKDEIPLTKKQCGGTGIKSILYTAERYDGTAGFSVVGDRFITQIVLNGRGDGKKEPSKIE